MAVPVTEFANDMNHYNGSCTCGSAHFEIDLSAAISAYFARACDCSFCTSKNARYLSDPKGGLKVRFSGTPDIIQQGSEQAEFLHCPQCGDLVCVICRMGRHSIGAINTSISPIFDDLTESVSTSPQLLSAQEKIDRWQSVWFPVDIEN